MADWMEELERLAELRDKDLITDEEYEAERAKIVPSPASKTPESKQRTSNDPQQGLSKKIDPKTGVMVTSKKNKSKNTFGVILLLAIVAVAVALVFIFVVNDDDDSVSTDTTVETVSTDQESEESDGLSPEERSARDWISRYLESSVGVQIRVDLGQDDEFIEECLMKEIERIGQGTPKTNTNFWRTQKEKFVNGDYNLNRETRPEGATFIPDFFKSDYGINLTNQEKNRVRNCASNLFSGNTFQKISSVIDEM